MVDLKSGIRFRSRLLLAALSAGLIAVVACTSVPPTATPFTLPPTPTAITFPPTPTAITFPPTPTPVTLPSTATPTPIVVSSPTEPTPTPTRTPFPTRTPTPTPSPVPSPVATPTPGGPTVTPTAVPSVQPPLTTVEIARRILPSVVRIAVDTGTTQGTGTGIVFDEEGKILTNWHVVEDAVSISVTKPDESVVSAELFRGDPDADIALIVVKDVTNLDPPLFGDSTELEVGDDVVAIGHALGLPGPPTISKGVVSALDRSLPNGPGGELTGLIQTDAAINSGNSGGPLVNDLGQVIGMNTARLSSGDRIGFAINIENALETADELILLGPIPPPGFLGIVGRTMFQPEAINLGLPGSGGLVVQVVAEGSPAHEAGMQPADVIVQMNTTRIRSEFDFTSFLILSPAESEVRIFGWRLVLGSGWQPIVIDAVLSTRP